MRDPVISSTGRTIRLDGATVARDGRGQWMIIIRYHGKLARVRVHQPHAIGFFDRMEADALEAATSA